MKETRDEGPKEEIYTKLAARSENTYKNRKDGRNDQDACSRNAGKLDSEIPSACAHMGLCGHAPEVALVLPPANLPNFSLVEGCQNALHFRLSSNIMPHNISRLNYCVFSIYDAVNAKRIEDC